MKKLIAAILAVCLMSTLAVSSFAYSGSTDFSQASQKITNSGENIEPYSVGTVVIFVAGIAVAMIVDGVLIYTTGNSGGEWVAAVLEYFERNPQVSTIYVSSSGAIHGGGGTGFR